MVTIIDSVNATSIALRALSHALSHFDMSSITRYVIIYKSTGKQISNIIVFALLLDIDSWIHIFYLNIF